MDKPDQMLLLDALHAVMSEKALLLPESRFRGMLSSLQAAAALDTPKRRLELPEDVQKNAAARATSVTQIAAVNPTQGVIACIPVYGVLNKAYDWCGMCSTDRLLEQLAGAVADQAVTAVILDIDSPGGFVNGSVEFADAVAEANKTKPVTAVIRGLCCSGAYWIASQCGKIVSRPESEVGNIGVYSVLMDISKWCEGIGISLTTVASGQFKGLGADGKVTDDLVSDTRRIVTGLYQQFVNAVAGGRKLELAEAMNLSDGRAFLGSQAKSLGLVDELASSFGAAIQAATGATAAPESEKSSMGKPNTTPAAATATAPASSTAPKAEDKQSGSSNEKAREVLQSTITSAGTHKDQVRKALDQASDMTEDPDEQTKSLAKRAVTSLKATSDESSRAAKAWLTLAGEDEDDDDDDDSPTDGDGKDKENKGQTAAQFVSAFGDAGARWFLEGKSFASCAAEHITALKAQHKTETDALKAENAELKKRLGAIDRGNEPAAASIPESAQAGPSSAKKLNGLSPNLQKFAANLKFAGTLPKPK